MKNKEQTIEIEGSRLTEFLKGARQHLTLGEKLVFIILIPPAIAFTIACFVFAYYVAKLSNLL